MKSLIHDDCLDALDKIDYNSTDLVYMDPPFFTQRTHSQKTRDNKREYSFPDQWENIAQYSDYIKERIKKCHKILKRTGSIFLHCDKSASQHLRIVLDEVFGSENFQSEIVWYYRRWSNTKKGLLNCHQIIFFYSKTKHFKFNQIFSQYSPTTNVDQIFQKRIRDKNGKSAYKIEKDGEYVLQESKKGVPLSDVWEIPYLNPKATERVGYPTQKPVLLLEQIINLVTDKNDLVVDPFCGSGTTLVAAKLLNRRFIGIDNSKQAIELCKKRIEHPMKTESDLLKKGKSAYLNQDPEIIKTLNKINAITVQRNKGIDGFIKKGDLVKPIPIRFQRKDETFEIARRALLDACKKNGFKSKILVKHENSKEWPILETNDGLLVLDNTETLSKHLKIFLKYFLR